MSHELEMESGVASMAYAESGGKPWHNLGFSFKGNLTPKQIQKLAKLNYTVDKVPCYATINGKKIDIGHDALVRSIDSKLFDVVTRDWNTVQNDVAFDFFTEWCKTGKMSMETAGALKGGQLVWALAKLNDGFSLFKGKDKIEGYMLFTNPHIYGMSTSVSLTNIRVVCWNTLTASLNNSKGDKIIRVSHRKEFDSEQVKDTLGIAHAKIQKYKEAAQFLAATPTTPEDSMEYFKTIFPVLTQKTDSKKEVSKGAQACFDVLDTQPGAEFGQGTWWQNLNAVTYHLDHKAGRSVDSRLTSAWYGQARKLKVKALEVAVDMADAA